MHLSARITALQGSGKLEKLPPMLAFQSAADATVTASALIEHLFARLPAAGHELVLIDINREVDVDFMLKNDPGTTFLPLLRERNRPYRLTLLTNGLDESGVVSVYAVPKESIEPERMQNLHAWPRDIYSLSHVSLPFPPDDPLYGGPDSARDGTLHLGNLALRGEHEVLHISAADILRLRWNPFFDYFEERVLNFMALNADTDSQFLTAD
jgi:hypothetical protein